MLDAFTITFVMGVWNYVVCRKMLQPPELYVKLFWPVWLLSTMLDSLFVTLIFALI